MYLFSQIKPYIALHCICSFHFDLFIFGILTEQADGESVTMRDSIPEHRLPGARLIPLSQAPAGSQPRAPKTKVYEVCINIEHANDQEHLQSRPQTAAGGAGLRVLNARKTATAPVLMPGA
jgi:hypothetical protein